MTTYQESEIADQFHGIAVPRVWASRDWGVALDGPSLAGIESEGELRFATEDVVAFRRALARAVSEYRMEGKFPDWLMLQFSECTDPEDFLLMVADLASFGAPCERFIAMREFADAVIHVVPSQYRPTPPPLKGSPEWPLPEWD